MLVYKWICHVCNLSNQSTTDIICSNCATPAVLTGNRVEKIQVDRVLETSNGFIPIDKIANFWKMLKDNTKLKLVLKISLIFLTGGVTSFGLIFKQNKHEVLVDFVFMAIGLYFVIFPYINDATIFINTILRPGENLYLRKLTMLITVIVFFIAFKRSILA